MTRRFRCAVIGVLGLAVLGPVEVHAQRQTSTLRGESIDTTFRMERGGVVDLELVSGDIIVTGTTGNQVRIRATAGEGRLVLRASPTLTTLRVQGEHDRGRTRASDVRYEVSVPSGVRVLMEAVSGSLTARGVDGDVDAEIMSGSIELRDIGGLVSVESVSGGVTVSGIRGDLHIEATSGPVSVTDASADVLVEHTSGPITLTDIRSRRVRVESVSGRVRFQGTLDANGRYEFESHSGTIELALPSSVNAQLALSTFGGSIRSEFPITLEPRSRSAEKRLEFRLGSGGARVTAETFSGSISITRGAGRDQQE